MELTFINHPKIIYELTGLKIELHTEFNNQKYEFKLYNGKDMADLTKNGQAVDMTKASKTEIKVYNKCMNFWNRMCTVTLKAQKALQVVEESA